MPSSLFSRRNFVKTAGTLVGGSLLSQTVGCRQPAMPQPKDGAAQDGPADYTLTIAGEAGGTRAETHCLDDYL